MDENKMIDKIKKLLAKSDSAKELGNTAEAETYAMKVQELLIQHNLEMADLKEEEKSEIIMEVMDLKDIFNIGKSEGPWITQLIGTLAMYNLCRIIIIGRMSGNKIYIFGEEHNIEVVKYMHDQIVTKVKKLSLKAWSEYRGMEKRNTFLRGYKSGVVIGITSKLREQQANQMNQYEGMTGLVKVNDHKLNDRINMEFGGGLGTAKNRRLSGQDGSNRGFQDGKNMNLSKGIGRSSGNSQKLIG